MESNIEKFDIATALADQRARLVYTRKVPGTGDRAALGRKQQRLAVVQKFGGIRADAWFRDTTAGRRLDRPVLRRLFAYCVSNPQSRICPGWICAYDSSRLLGPGHDRCELYELHGFQEALAHSHWELRFVLEQPALQLLHEASELARRRAQTMAEAHERARRYIEHRLATRDREADARAYYQAMYEGAMRRIKAMRPQELR